MLAGFVAEEGEILVEQTMQLRFLQVQLQQGAHQQLDVRLQVGHFVLAGDIEDYPVHRLRVAFVEGGNQRVLVREVLVHRADTNPGALRHQVGVGTGVTVLDHDGGGSLEDGLDHHPRAGLCGYLARKLSLFHE